MGTYNKISAGPTTYIRFLMPGIHLRRKERYIEMKRRTRRGISLIAIYVVQTAIVI